MAHASTDRSVGRRSGSDSAAADLHGTFAAGEGVVGASLAMTPAAALARHVEWLDFALEAATAEERWRRERLAKATKGNREKRTDRLAEVVAEIEELSALLSGIRDLERRAATAPTPRRRGRPPGSKNGTGKRSASAASAAAKAPAAKAPAAKAPAAKAPAAKAPAAKAPATGRRRGTAAKAPATRSAAAPAGAAQAEKPATSTARRRRSTSTPAG